MVFSAINWDFNPEIFSIGNHGVRWYGLMIALALLTGYLIFKRYLRGDKLTSEMVDSLLVYVAIAGIVGARLGHCFL
jgi:phosphatidylglycerol:prolipoprotein diacylglycerol transferase